ncbi:MAG: hypothetical protein M5U28_26700 [Sandaracinaceae bacterium]|nr:hypothetical protein [Sandaracinaceae bacterium]
MALTVALMIDPLTAREDAEEEEPPPEDPVVIVRTERVEVPVERAGPRWRVEIDTALVGALGLLPTPALGGWPP